MKTFLVLMLFVGTVYSCQVDFDCSQCHFCKNHVCTPVPDYTDPNEECPIRCNVRTVCGPLHICVFEHRPTCNCDWLEGTCRPDPEEPIIAELPPVDVLHGRGFSDDDIRELMEHVKQERAYHRDLHKDHFHILPDDESAAHDFIMIYTAVLVILFVAIILCVISCLWRRLLDKEQYLSNKSQ